MANHETQALPTDTALATGRSSAVDAVSKLPGDPTPSEALAALRQDGQASVAGALALEQRGLLYPMEIAGLSGDEAKIAADYTQHFAATAMPTMEQGTDPKTGASVMIFRDGCGQLQEVSIVDNDLSSHQYLADGNGAIDEGRSFDRQGHGVNLEHVKWTVNAVTRVDGQGTATTNLYDDNTLLKDHP